MLSPCGARGQAKPALSSIAISDGRRRWVSRRPATRTSSPTAPDWCDVTSRITADAVGLLGALVAPIMRRKLRGTVSDVLADLVAYAETGQPSQA